MKILKFIKKFRNTMVIVAMSGLMLVGVSNIAQAITIGVPTSIKLVPTSNGRIDYSLKLGKNATGTLIGIFNKPLLVELGGDVHGATKGMLVNCMEDSTTFQVYCRAYRQVNKNTRLYSNQVGPINVTTAPSHPYAPTKAKVYKYNNKIKLVWSRATGVSGYEVYRSTSYRGKYTMVARTSNSSFVNSVAKGHYYYYKVRSFKATYYTRVYSNAWSNLTCIRF